MKARWNAREATEWTAFRGVLRETEPIPDRHDVEWHVDAVVAALRGLDEIEIGPGGYGQMSLEQLRENRPGDADRVRWDPIPERLPITSMQRQRVEHVLRTGSPAGRQAP